MSDREKTTAILEALKRCHADKIWAAELSLEQGGRRCDFWSLHPHRSKGYLAEAFEIKVSRADFKRDDEAKQRSSRLYSDRFWYVAPVGLIKPEEVPVWAGLKEFNGEHFITKVQAPHRDKDAPSWELVVSMIRNCGEINRETDIMKVRLRQLERDNKHLSEANLKMAMRAGAVQEKELWLDAEIERLAARQKSAAA